MKEDNRNIEERLLEAREHTSRAMELMTKKEYLEAAKVLAQVHGTYLNSWGLDCSDRLSSEEYTQAHILLAESLYKGGKLDTCIFACKDALKYFPGEPRILRRLTDAYIANNDYGEAKKDLNKAIQESAGECEDLKLYLKEVHVMEDKAEAKKRALWRSMVNGITHSHA